jgi:hypothetical protein
MLAQEPSGDEHSNMSLKGEHLSTFLTCYKEASDIYTSLIAIPNTLDLIIRHYGIASAH